MSDVADVYTLAEVRVIAECSNYYSKEHSSHDIVLQWSLGTMRAYMLHCVRFAVSYDNPKFIRTDRIVKRLKRARELPDSAKPPMRLAIDVLEITQVLLGFLHRYATIHGVANLASVNGIPTTVESCDEQARQVMKSLSDAFDNIDVQYPMQSGMSQLDAELLDEGMTLRQLWSEPFDVKFLKRISDAMDQQQQNPVTADRAQ